MTDEQEDHKAALEIFKGLVQFTTDTIEPYKPEWAERRETAKTLFSLSSAALIFTITFSTSIISPSTPMVWRYSILVCWLAFACSLACGIGSIWFSMGLSSLPLLVEQQRDQTVERLKAAMQTQSSKVEKVSTLIEEQVTKLAREDLAVHWLLRASLACFGLALLILTSVGVRQMLR